LQSSALEVNLHLPAVSTNNTGANQVICLLFREGRKPLGKNVSERSLHCLRSHFSPLQACHGDVLPAACKFSTDLQHQNACSIMQCLSEFSGLTNEPRVGRENRVKWGVALCGRKKTMDWCNCLCPVCHCAERRPWHCRLELHNRRHSCALGSYHGTTDAPAYRQRFPRPSDRMMLRPA
jgi:hypothetical protein